ncbi:STAS domain-containing protein [Umezawaea sp. Da 62-37]|uniref:STAS domain-containing protein n=1 Tax=Umezawaea sp. Da 62-37 TaxID=3075927 RepID=UPI0028F72004|nr:STAS domain-containing protein [Umezawaea sp. Da 62-37]WNV89046.1 STAS domain-containing protein [Umezawaea sp. Da 62-37]
MPTQASSPAGTSSDSDLTTPATVVTLVGEIDANSTGPVRLRVFDAFDADPSAVVLDLTGVEFFGSTGIAVVLAAAQRADRRGVRFAVVANQRCVLRPLRVTGVTAHVAVHPDVDSALAALSRPAPRIPAARTG